MNVQDRRRLLGPGNAKPIAFASSLEPETEPLKAEEVAKKDGIPSLSIKSDIIENCNGSTLIESDEFSIVTSVYGPKSIRGSFTSQGTISIQLKNGIVEKYQTNELKEVASWLVGIFNSVVNLEKYPKSGIDIFVNLVIDKTNDISKLIPFIVMSTCLALVDSGIEMIDLTTAAEIDGNVISFTKGGEEIVGFWKDNGDAVFNDEDFTSILGRCKEQYINYKSLMVNYLLQGKKK
ncbi:exosome non-catalytic core subunit MTR3 NDAI_0D02820 [Naumovozyma dairenensis CBS 421]|uniref:Exoribonuclease phosphorolytic domain-containing protein n=1 Tax=Naumovozyma dairenensis (strain ATCC 10597 / BCRC 20456 / CBS 421 / NBRC 0211 / NRRL Y-12639) TaxID=1071378 RepID=G0W9Y5_NAUDC|nr:hypothetical protein NDAI_0D02820 [Naumovozyma dairenensis CBS 421]CCD24596.1 hypothetical protein NDAI_0D02820 [Naumovozyma dairenensis CBS 421]